MSRASTIISRSGYVDVTNLVLPKLNTLPAPAFVRVYVRLQVCKRLSMHLQVHTVRQYDHRHVCEDVPPIGFNVVPFDFGSLNFRIVTTKLGSQKDVLPKRVLSTYRLECGVSIVGNTSMVWASIPHIGCKGDSYGLFTFYSRVCVRAYERLCKKS